VKSKKAKIYAIRYTLYAIVGGCLLVAAAGCENGGKSPLAVKVDTLRLEKRQLARQIEKSKTEAEQLRDLRQIKITRYTNLYDKDKDGQKEKLIVYIQPIDEQGDIVKASGAVDVQLWDLNKKARQALLGQWHVKPDELKKLWYATLITINYRLTFDVADKIDKFDEPLTVKVTFTDYLSGKVFKEQKVIKPR
jgi:hypothetical protein